MTAPRLEIYARSERVGCLVLEEDRLWIEYDPAWRNTSGQPLRAFPLSPPLSFESAAELTPEAWSARCRRFLGNLLPEGRQIDDILAVHSIRKGDVFSMLRVLGRESAGALSFLPEGQVPLPIDQGDRRVVPREELSERIRELDHTDDGRSLAIWDGRARLSAIAGVQEKLPARMEGAEIQLVDGGLASTHILKPEAAKLPGIVANEAFCMRLARACGIPAASAWILSVPEPVLVVERFDRIRKPHGVERFHIIDACQALDRSVNFKYERNLGSGRDVAHIRDGVSLMGLFSLSSTSPEPARLRMGLLRRVIFNHAIGNSDAHGKNFSFHVTPSGLWLSPAYDLVSVALHPEFDQHSAMAIGSQFDPGSVTLEDWEEFAVDCGLPPGLVMRELASMAKRLRKAVEEVRAAGGWVEAGRVRGEGRDERPDELDGGARVAAAEIGEKIMRVVEGRIAGWR